MVILWPLKNLLLSFYDATGAPIYPTGHASWTEVYFTVCQSICHIWCTVKHIGFLSCDVSQRDLFQLPESPHKGA